MAKRIMLIIGIVVLLVLAGGGGFLLGRAQASQAALAARARFGGQGGQGGQQGGPRMGDFSRGTVDSVEGDTLTLKAQDGTLVVVKTTSTTMIQKMADVPLTDLAKGEQVMVNGTKNADGSITARSVQSVRGAQLQSQSGN
jgi:hypothetical protein